MICYLICGEAFTLVTLSIASEAYQNANRRSAWVPWAGAVLTVLVWPITFAITLVFCLLLLWRAR